MEEIKINNDINNNNADYNDIMDNILLSKHISEEINFEELISTHSSNIKIKKDIKKPNFISQNPSETKNEQLIVSSETLNQNWLNKDNNNIEDKSSIKLIFEEFIGRNSLIKRTYSMPDLVHKTIKDTMRKTVLPLCKEIDKNINFSELNNLYENKNNKDNPSDLDEEERLSIFNINKNINNSDFDNKKREKEEENEDEDEDELQKKNSRSKSFSLEKEMTSNYYEENEHKNNNIIFFKNSINDIKMLSCNLMLKKIIFEDFLKKQAQKVYHFCQQCFCFMKIDIFFRKILNCYIYYRKKNLSIEKILNLIDFFNILIIEMFEYYKIIPKEYLQTIKTVYNTIISDLIIYNNYNNNYFEMKIDKNEFINKNLLFNEKEEEFGQERDIKYNDEKFNKYKMNNNLQIEEENENFSNGKDNDYIIIQEDEGFFDENIYNEQKEIENFINKTFLQDFFIIPRNSLSPYNDTISIVNPLEKFLVNLKIFLNLFKFKRPDYDKLDNVKKSLSFYKYLKELENHKNEINKLKNKNKKNLNIRRSLCLSQNEKIHSDKNIDKRIYLQKGFFSIYDWEPEEIGEELIRVTKKLLSGIERRELYKAIYLKKNKNITSPNVVENIDNFNKLTFFIIEDIISYDHCSDRAKVMDKWAHVAEFCKSKKDYNDCIAINSALNSYIITGLNLTNKELKTKTINLIKNIGNFCQCDGNYKNIREEIKKLNNLKESYYPYLGMMLRDITFFEESSKYLVDGELINFEKIENIHNLIENNFRFIKEERKQEDNYIYIKELSFFEHLEMNTEENLESIANKIEPKFEYNKGKKEFKRKTNIDEKYFKQYENNLMFRKSINPINKFFSFGN